MESNQRAYLPRNLGRFRGFTISIFEWRWPRGFSTSIWMEGNQGAFLPQNLGRLRGFSILILNCNDQGASLPRSEWKVTKGLLYLGTWDNWEASLSQSLNGKDQGASLPRSEWKVTKGLLYIETWGDWEASLSQSWMVAINGLLYLDLNGR